MEALAEKPTTRDRRLIRACKTASEARVAGYFGFLWEVSDLAALLDPNRA
jgi:hypothetical protein